MVSCSYEKDATGPCGLDNRSYTNDMNIAAEIESVLSECVNVAGESADERYARMSALVERLRIAGLWAKPWESEPVTAAAVKVHAFQMFGRFPGAK